MLTTLLSGLAGGLLRIAPEILKWLDRNADRAHEYRMTQLQIEVTKISGDYRLREKDYEVEAGQLQAILAASRDQGQTARAAGKWVAAISALVRPMVTYWFVFLYSAVKISGMLLARSQGANWRDVLLSSWTSSDMDILVMILVFWFVGRVWDKKRSI